MLNTLFMLALLALGLFSSAEHAAAGMLQWGVSSTAINTRGDSSARPNTKLLNEAFRSSWLSRVVSCTSQSAPGHAGPSARRQLQECSCSPQQAQQVDIKSADSFLITSGSASAAVANSSGADSNNDGIADQLLLMKIKVLPVPASKIQRQLETGRPTFCPALYRLGVTDGNKQVYRTAQTAPCSAL
jgi:hypothetical protein